MVQHSCSNLSLTNTSVVAVRTSGFRFSVFRFYSVFLCLRLFHDTPTIQVKHPQCNTHPVYHLQLQREGSSVVSRQLQANQEKSSFLAFFFVQKW